MLFKVFLWYEPPPPTPPNKETLNEQKPQDCNCDVKLETSSI